MGFGFGIRVCGHADERWIPFIPTPGSSARSSVAPESNEMMRELVIVYKRLRKTLETNGLQPQSRTLDRADDSDSGEYSATDGLVRSVGYSISAVEIQQRGTDAEYGMTLLEKIPSQQLTHLRILAENVTSFIAVGGQRGGGENR